LDKFHKSFRIKIRGGFLPRYLIQGLTHTLVYMFFLSTLFAVFWVKTSGMDSRSQAVKDNFFWITNIQVLGKMREF
jgi:preprotein translocase subunit SecY